jgi:hypothetical protein
MSPSHVAVASKTGLVRSGARGQGLVAVPWSRRAAGEGGRPRAATSLKPRSAAWSSQTAMRYPANPRQGSSPASARLASSTMVSSRSMNTASIRSSLVGNRL